MEKKEYRHTGRSKDDERFEHAIPDRPTAIIAGFSRGEGKIVRASVGRFNGIAAGFGKCFAQQYAVIGERCDMQCQRDRDRARIQFCTQKSVPERITKYRIHGVFRSLDENPVPRRGRCIIQNQASLIGQRPGNSFPY